MRGFYFAQRYAPGMTTYFSFIRVYSLKPRLFYKEIKQTQPRISVYRFFVAKKKITYS